MAKFTVNDYKDMTALDMMLTIQEFANDIFNTYEDQEARVNYSKGLVKASFSPVFEAANPDGTIGNDEELIVNACYGFILFTNKEGSSLKAEETLTRITGTTFPDDGIAQHIITIFAYNLVTEFKENDKGLDKDSKEVFNEWIIGVMEA